MKQSRRGSRKSGSLRSCGSTRPDRRPGWDVLPEARDQQRDFLRIEGQVRGASSEDLTDENAKLKKLLAEAMLDNPMLINSKNGDTRRE
jgi:hypothetical protein